MGPELAAALVCWRSRDHTLEHIGWLATQPETAELCKASGGLDVSTWAAHMVNDIMDADICTGRGMYTSQVVAAERIGRDVKQVARARWVSIQLGIMVEYFRGYQLSGEQRLELLEDDPDNEQRGIPNAYAIAIFPARQRRRITIPKPGCYAQVDTNVDLPSFTHLGLSAHLLGPLSFAAADATEPAAPSAAPLPRRKRRPGSDLAHEMLAHPGLRLFTGVRAGFLAAQLKAYRLGGWHGYELADVLIQTATDLGWDTTRRVRKPPAALKTLLSHIDPIRDVVMGEPAPVTPEAVARAERELKHLNAGECDTGWIQVGAAFARCPHCAPAPTTYAAYASASLDTAYVDDTEPPF